MRHARHIASQFSFAVGTVWAVSGGGRLVFGERITVPILPELDLSHVSGWSSVCVALGWFLVAGLLGRHARAVGDAAVPALRARPEPETGSHNILRSGSQLAPSHSANAPSGGDGVRIAAPTDLAPPAPEPAIT